MDAPTAGIPGAVQISVRQEENVMNCLRKSTLLLCATFLSMSLALAQSGPDDPGAGLLPFSTQVGGANESVDLATSNVFVTIPLRSKAGKVPFELSLSGNFHPWIGSIQDGQQWNVTAGLTGGPSGLLGGRLSYTIKDNQGCSPYVDSEETVYGIVDGTGALHSAPATIHSNSHCGATSATVNAKDDSGLSAYVTYGSYGYTLYDRSGNVLTINSTTHNQTLTDPDLTTMQQVFTSWPLVGSYTDTLAQTPISFSFGNPTGNPDTYTFTGGDGNTQTYTVKYLTKTLATAFHCTSPLVAEANQKTIYLPTTITFKTTGETYTLTYEQTPGYSSSYSTGRLTSITFPSGGSVSYTYSDSSGHNGIECHTGVVPTLTRTVKDNNGNTSTYTYIDSDVENGTDYTVTADFPYVHGNANNSTIVFSFKDTLQTEAQYYQGTATGTPLKTVLTCYNANFTTCATPPSVPSTVTQTDVYTYLGASTPSLVETTFDTYGNTTSLARYDFGTTIPPTAPTLVSTTNTVYGTWNGSSCTALGNYITDKPCYIRVVPGSGSPAYTSLTYFVNSTAGHPTEIERWVSGTSYLDTSYTYNPNGTPINMTEPNGAITTYGYADGCNNLLLTSTSYDVDSLKSSQTWDCDGGVVTSSTGVDGNKWNYAYVDPHWRQTQVTDPTNYSVNYAYTPTSVTTTSSFNSGTLEHVTTLDGLTRPILDQTLASAGNYDTVVTTYDLNGRIAHVTAPFNCTTLGSGCSSATQSSTTYDALGRVLIATDVNGGIMTHTYTQNDDLAVLTPTPSGDYSTAGKTRQTQVDGLGRITSVCEVTAASGSAACGQTNSKNGYLTTYAYSTLDQLTGVTQGSQSRGFSYDGLGRLYQESNPENGTTNYNYDADATNCNKSAYAGDLNSIRRNSTDYTCFKYDLMHRVTETWHPGATNTDNAFFQWDSATYGSIALGQGGQVAEAWTCALNTDCAVSASKTLELFRYDMRGNLTEFNQQSPNSGGLYGSTVEYDAVGNKSSLVVGNAAENVTPTLTIAAYDGEGRPTQINASTGTSPVAKSIAYTYFGPTAVTYGSLDNDAFTYDNLGHMRTYTYNIGLQSYAGTLTWNANGTLGSLKTVNGLTGGNGGTTTVSYNYDDLTRIWKASDGVNIAQTYTYDPYGNISTDGAPASWMPTYVAGTNRYQAEGTCGASGSICYDADGNLLSDTFYNYTWNAEDKLASVNGGTAVVYDAFNRALEDYNGIEFLFVPGFSTAFVNMSGQTLTGAYIPLPGGGRVVYTPSGIQNYMHPDWNSASRVSSTPSRTLYSQTEYSPFGISYLKSDSNPQLLFDDSGSDLVGEYSATNRQLHATQGRWIQPDLAGKGSVDPTNPQTWNRYAYALNNPLALFDPLGLDCIYLNDSGTGLAPNGGIDTNSDIGECGTNGGYWVDGSYTKGWYNTSNNDIYLQGSQNGMFTDSYSNTITTNSVGGPTDTSGFGGPLFQLGNLPDVALPPVAQTIITQVGIQTSGFTKQLNCAAAAAYPFISGPKPEDVEGIALDGAETAAEATGGAADGAADTLKAVGRLGPSRLGRIASLESTAKRFEAGAKILNGVGKVLSAQDSYKNLTECEGQR